MRYTRYSKYKMISLSIDERTYINQYIVINATLHQNIKMNKSGKDQFLK